jgi:hypothetical protein
MYFVDLRAFEGRQVLKGSFAATLTVLKLQNSAK